MLVKKVSVAMFSLSRCFHQQCFSEQHILDIIIADKGILLLKQCWIYQSGLIKDIINYPSIRLVFSMKNSGEDNVSDLGL